MPRTIGALAGAGHVLASAFAWLLTLVETDKAVQGHAAYGGIYIVSSVVWLWLAEVVVRKRVCGGRYHDAYGIRRAADAHACLMTLLSTLCV